MGFSGSLNRNTWAAIQNDYKVLAGNNEWSTCESQEILDGINFVERNVEIHLEGVTFDTQISTLTLDTRIWDPNKQTVMYSRISTMCEFSSNKGVIYRLFLGKY